MNHRLPSAALSALLVVILPSASLAFAEGGLEPLEYNHPGLTVDLGVGLWAWPMPVDYDGDGDIDLLVACPDKPSNGVWYFENPSQDRSAKMPVFKPGVRLGSATHNMQISYVRGEARILAPGVEHVGFRVKGFENPTKIYPRGNIHQNPVRANMWRYVDYNGNGVHDLIVGVGDWTDYGWDHAYDAQGRWRNGPLHGYVYWIENRGTDAQPDYSDAPLRIRAGGGEIDVYGWPSPSFGDFDGDGDLDLICGEFLDGFTYFANIGTRQQPRYAAPRRLVAADGEPLRMDLQMITPVAFDWTGNGRLDLIVGDEDGRVALVEGAGRFRNGAPVFEQPRYFQQEADTLKFGALATPFAYDWDGDGDEDILCGNTAGQIAFFENLGEGEAGLPKWAAPRLFEVDGKPFRIMAGPSGSIQGPCEAKWGYTTLSVGQVDSDGKPAIVFSSIFGEPTVLRRKGGLLETELSPFHVAGEGDAGKPRWTWWDAPRDPATPIQAQLLTQWRTTPLIYDLTGNGLADFVGLDHEGYLALSAASLVDGVVRRSAFERIFVDEDNRPIRLNARSCGGSGRAKLAIVDWDGDGRPDLLVNSENACLYRNCEDRDGKIVLKKIGNLAAQNVAGHTTSPAVCNFDGDGKPDLLVGAEDGQIYHIRHQDCVSFSAEALLARAPEAEEPPRFPGFLRDEFVYIKAPFPQCHASTICQTSRGLVCAWFGGTREKDPDVGIWVSYHDGAGWTGPKEVANGVQYEGHRHPTWNPVLFQPPGDGPTLLFFKVGPDPRTWWGEMLVSYDRGRTWRERRRLPEQIDGPVRCKPILLDDGTLLAGSSTEYDGWRVHFEKSADLGKTWRRIGPINTPEQFNAIQPTFLRHPDGRLQVLCRTREGVISTSFSADGGETWSKMEATDLPNPNAGIDVVTLTDGRHLMIYNHLGSGDTGWGRRGMLNLAVSDDGLSWRAVGVLEQEEKAEFSYPAIIQTEDGLVHMTYTWKRQRIKHAVVDPAGIEAGPVLGQRWPKD